MKKKGIFLSVCLLIMSALPTVAKASPLLDYGQRHTDGAAYRYCIAYTRASYGDYVYADAFEYDYMFNKETHITYVSSHNGYVQSEQYSYGPSMYYSKCEHGSSTDYKVETLY